MRTLYNIKYISLSSFFTLLVSMVCAATPEILFEFEANFSGRKMLLGFAPPDSNQADTPSVKLPFPIRDRKPYERSQKRHPFDLGEPSNIRNKYSLDSNRNEYNFKSTVGGQDYRLPASVPVNEQLKSENERQNKDYFRQRAQAQNFASGSGIIPPLKIGPKIFDRIFGSGIIDIKPRGTAELTFAGNFNTVRNPAIAQRQQSTGQFDFKPKLQLNVQGSIGDKMKINMNYDTEATFDFENQMKLDYGGKEDDIIKKIELGNVSLPLNSSLIQGSQSLFGVKATMQFGRLTVTSIVTQQRGKTTETELQGGVQTTRFDIQADNYDMNRHYFLAQYFRDNYDNALSNLPIVNSPVVINRVEVWITNRSASVDNARSVMGFSDLGEGSKRNNKGWAITPNGFDTFPNNTTNDLYKYLSGQTPINSDTASLRQEFNIQNQLVRDQAQTGLQPISQYQMISYARLLSVNEYTINSRLGYISLNTSLNNDEVLCVAYEYTINGQYFKVGEFSTDIPINATTPNVLFLKMLKGPSLRPDLPMWDLMMKNIYSLGTFNIQPKDFKLSVIYADDPSGADLNYIPQQNEPLLTGVPLLTVLNLDNLNTQQERAPDGLFDYIEGVTVSPQQGRVMFPVVEPFGSYLSRRFVNNPDRARYYSFYELYDSTRFAAIQLPQYNKFFLRGTYQGSSSNEISLNSTNIPRGSVKVTANGAPLTENADYVVDYNLGRVKIINTGLLNSGATIKVSSESNSLFSVQQKSLLGTRFDYKQSNDFIFGGTFLYLNERPLTPKVNIGEEPISNMIIGLDGTYKKDSRFLTKLVDKLPFIATKETSNITVSGEIAKLIPGIQGALAQKGTAYLDDFEGSETPFDLRQPGNYGAWSLAATPQGQPDLFPEGSLTNDLSYGFKRSSLAWYSISSDFYRNNNITPNHIKSDDEQLSDDCVREINLRQIFPDRQVQQGMPTNLPTLDLAYYPKERGPYNYNVDELNADGTLANPTDKWAGITRRIDQNDFEAANIDYIEIWMMDPYACKKDENNTGEIYLNLGNISEDVLRDNRRSAENGLPKTLADNNYIDTTVWGRVPRKPVINFAFDSDPAVRTAQDVGFDGFNDDGERAWFDSAYVQKVNQKYPGSQAATNASADPSNDNYHYFLGSDFDNASTSIVNRYRKFNNTQGNSPTLDQSTESYPTTGSTTPENEDINKDYTLNDIEEYYQYKIDISKGRLVVGQNYVTDSVRRDAELANGSTRSVTWYQLKIPVREYQKRIGQIYDFKSIRFMRMFMRGFSDDMLLRFAYLQLVRADWRKYQENLETAREGQPNDDPDNTKFVVSTVNIEKNSKRSPLNYVTPPGIQREVDFSAPQAFAQNEQSLSLQVCDLRDGDARAAFKNISTDLRRYGKMRMFIHAEGLTDALRNGDLHAFIRIGTDLTGNYYEFQMPLNVTVPPTTDPNAIWPASNEMVIDLEELINTKIARTNANFPFTSVYERQGPNGIYRVVGLPDLSQARVVMLGVRNPKSKPGNGDDGLTKCGEVWFNELRMTDFASRGGFAATGRVLAKLADFGNMQLTGSLSTVGWGGIDKKLNERSLDDQYQYDVQGNFELGKFFPVKTGLSIPIFLSYGNTTIRPYYNPLNPDVVLQKEIDESTNEDYRDKIRKAADDFTARKSLNFTNVRKNRVGTKKQHLYDIENFSFTYAYTETYRRNQTIQYYILQNYRGQIAYNYTFNSKPWEPFSKLIKSKQLQLIKDFNLYFKPQSWGARVEADRRYGVTVNRNNDNPNTVIQPLYDKLFTMNRYYEFRHDITRGLKFDYTSTAMARIDEPLYEISDKTPEKKDTIWDNFLKGGRLTQFDQAIRLNYNIPINKIQQLNWTSASYNYTANYQWKQAPPAADSLGNTIQNSRVEAWNVNLNLLMLYNKFAILRSLNNASAGKSKKGTLAGPKEQDNKKPTKKTKGKKGDKEEGDAEKKEKDSDALNPALAATLRLLTSVKNVSYQHTINHGMVLPGFNPKPQYVGQNFDEGAPGFDFITALQGDDYRFKAGRNGWLTKDPRISSYYLTDFRENISGRATLEPLPDFRVELNVTKSSTLTQQSLFRYDSITDSYRDVGPLVESGNYSISYNVFATTFSKELEDGTSEVFNQFQANRKIIADRLARDPNRPGGPIDTSGFPEGYSRYSQEVLIPAFLAAYSGKDASKISLSPFPKIPLPNWRVTYTGLTKIAAIKEYASNITINHQYQSSYNVGGFQTIIDTASTNISGDYGSKYQIRSISIVERWGPFIGVDVTLVNNVSARFEYKRDRTLNFALTNQQLSEQQGSEFVFGTGYRTQNLKIPFLRGGRTLVLKNDVNFRIDFSIRNQLTKIRNLDRPSNEDVQGDRVISIRPTIDYNINEKLVLRIFYDRRQTDPYISSRFPTVITSGGFSLRYTIQ